MKQKCANQQETIDFLLNQLQQRGVNLFNKNSIQDSSLGQSGKRNSGEEESDESDKYYYS